MKSTLALSILVAACLLLVGVTSAGAQATIPTQLTEDTLSCLDCHADETPAAYQQWGSSKHYRANVGCYECHKADASDPDAMEHNGWTISTIVSPKDCSQCHEREVQEFSESHHAKAGLILGSLDNFLADIVEGDWNFYGGSALTVSGCKQCHGGAVPVNEDGTLQATDLRHLPHVGSPHHRWRSGAGDSRRRPADLLEQPSAIVDSAGDL